MQAAMFVDVYRGLKAKLLESHARDDRHATVLYVMEQEKITVDSMLI